MYNGDAKAHDMVQLWALHFTNKMLFSSAKP